MSSRLAKANSIYKPNLLINGDFRIWQRWDKFTNVSNIYLADRWVTLNGITVSAEKVDKGMKITTSNSNIQIGQFIEGILDSSKKYAISLSMDDVVYNAVLSVTDTENFIASDKGSKVQFTLKRNGTTSTNLLISINSKSCVINYANLTIGEIATPIVIRPYAHELALCQRYYIKLKDICGNGNVYRSGVYACIPLPVTMRAKPTVTIHEYYTLVDGINSEDISYMNYCNIDSNMIFMMFIVNAEFPNSCDGKCARILPRTISGYISIDAEIYQ